MARQQATLVDVDDGDKDTLIDDYLLKKAVDGDPVAQLEVGKTYFHTDYTESNRFNTFDWISRSANQGNLEAQFRLGDLYSLGWGTKQCRTSAYEWYTKAAIQGYKKALIRIHNLYQEDIRMNCHGLLNSEEDGWWSDSRFIKDNNIRGENEYRKKKKIFILNGAMDYYANQFKKYKASNQEDPEVQQYLGFLYQHGYGVKKYASVAINYYTRAAEQGLVDAQYNLGFLYQRNTEIKFNYRKAFHWYCLAADGGNIAAQNRLAYFYEKGLATDIDYPKALHWYTKAANAGHSGAQVTLGKWYRQGQNIKQNYTQATKWYKLAADQGNQVARNCLDLLFQNGKIVEEEPDYSSEPSRKSRLCSKLRLDIAKLKDDIKIAQLKKLSSNAFKGDGNAMYEIGLNYYNGIDFTQDEDIGFKWIRNAANRDCKAAQFKLAKIYKQGDTVEQDYHKTSIWTKKLAKKKNDVGQYNLGVLYQNGQGVRQDYLEASKWFIFSSDQGNIDAMYELGMMRFNGIIFKMDIKEATEMYYTSAIGGNMDACYRLGDAYWYGDGVQQDQDKALKVYDYSARHGNTESQYRLGCMYEEGRNVEADQEKASEYYRMTLSTHHPHFVFNFVVKFLNGCILAPNKNEIFHLFNKLGTYGIFERRAFLTPIFFYDEIINCYNLIDMLIEISEYGIENLEYDIGYAYDYGKYSSTFKEVFESDYKKALKWYTISANKGDTRALYRLGLMHEAGKGTEQDLAVALDCYRKAADNNNNDAKYRLACMYLMGHSIPQDIVKAFYLFTDAANSNHLESIKALMLSNDTNDMVTDDFQKPISYEAAFIQDPQILFTEEDQIGMLETMAEEGLVAVQYQLGKLYQRKDNPTAAKWFNFAARGGISDACYRLGVFHEEGKYIQQNDERAIELYEQASKGDHEDAIYRLAKMYQSGKGTPVDYARAYNLYFRASEMGHNSAFKALNITTNQPDYSSGTTMKIISDTTSQEYQQSLLMCEHVAKEGDVELQYKIGTVYEYHLKEPNYSKALKWYEMAASNSHREAIHRLGLFYEKGLGVCQDYKKAIKLFEKAEDMNSSDAIFELGRAYEYGYGVDIDSNKAVKQYMLAATLGNPLAQHTLGMLYDESTLVPLNTLEALKWYTKAYSQGYDAARSNLFQLYDHSPYQDFFYQRLHILLERICSLGPQDSMGLDIVSYNYHCACQRLGYWYYQQPDFRRAWTYFSKSISKRSILSEPSVLESKYISSDHKNEILNTLQMQIELVDSLDGKVLCYLGLSYYWGVFEKPMENKFLGSEEVKNKTSTILKQDYPKAFFFLEKAAKKGNTQAQYYVGTMYHHGYGVETDFGKAQEWYDKASTDNREYALKVGMVYHCDGEFQDFSKALRIYEEAGFYHAGLVIGMLYQYGTGVEKNYKKAKKYFKERNGDLLQSFYRGVLYYDGPDDIQDYKRAFRFFQKVLEKRPNDDYKSIFARCRNDSEHIETGENYSFTLEPQSVFQGEAYYYLGIMYKNGQGTAQNELEAKKYFLKATEYGNKQAKQYIE